MLLMYVNGWAVVIARIPRMVPSGGTDVTLISINHNREFAAMHEGSLFAVGAARCRTRR